MCYEAVAALIAMLQQLRLVMLIAFEGLSISRATVTVLLDFALLTLPARIIQAYPR